MREVKYLESARLPWLLTPKRVKAYRRLRLERVRAGRFFNVTCQYGHVLEMSGLDLCNWLASLGDDILCPECSRYVRVVSIADGRSMTEQEKEQQMKGYLKWKEETERAGESLHG